jgi:hypothetical protein
VSSVPASAKAGRAENREHGHPPTQGPAGGRERGAELGVGLVFSTRIESTGGLWLGIYEAEIGNRRCRNTSSAVPRQIESHSAIIGSPKSSHGKSRT